MRMLRELMSRGEVDTAMRVAEKLPELLALQQPLAHLLSPSSSSSFSCRVFSFPFESPIYWFCLLLTKHKRPSLLLLRDISSPLDTAASAVAISQFLSEVSQFLKSTRSFSVYAESFLNFELLRQLPSVLPLHSPADRKPYHLFYMTKDQLQQLNELDINLPYGYSFGEANSDSEAELIASTSEEALTLDAVRHYLRESPSVVMRGPSGEISSFELTGETGSFIHLFTLPDHRRRGLATSVELRLAQITARTGRTPFKAVCTYDSSVHRSSEESSFWSVLHHNGCPVEITVSNMTSSAALS